MTHTPRTPYATAALRVTDAINNFASLIVLLDDILMLMKFLLDFARQVDSDVT